MVIAPRFEQESNNGAGDGDSTTGATDAVETHHLSGTGTAITAINTSKSTNAANGAQSIGTSMIFDVTHAVPGNTRFTNDRCLANVRSCGVRADGAQCAVRACADSGAQNNAPCINELICYEISDRPGPSLAEYSDRWGP